MISLTDSAGPNSPRLLTDELGIDLSAQGEPVPLDGLSIGDFILAVGQTEIASGRLNSIRRSGDSITLVLNVQLKKNYLQSIRITVDEPARSSGGFIFYRQEPEIETIQPRALGRVFGKQPKVTSTERSLSAILGPALEATEVRFGDKGRSMVISYSNDRNWQKRTIKEVTHTSSEAGEYFFVDLGSGGYSHDRKLFGSFVSSTPAAIRELES